MLFPACAGVILQQPEGFYTKLSFPRVCGGDPFEAGLRRLRAHFSPRVRG